MYPANSDLREGCIPKTSLKCISLIIDNYTITIFSNGIKVKKQNKTNFASGRLTFSFYSLNLKNSSTARQKKEPDDFTGFFYIYVFRTYRLQESSHQTELNFC